MLFLTERSAKVLGESAFYNGATINMNPYCRTTEDDKKLHEVWESSFLKAKNR